MEFLSKIIKVIFPMDDKDKHLLVEKRATPRIQCKFEGKVVRKGGKDIETCKIVEVGTHGMRLQSSLPAKVGDVLFVGIKSGQGIDTSRYKVDSVRADVVWTRRKPKTYEYYIGTKYSDKIDNINKSWVSVILRKFGFDATSSFQRRKEVRATSRLAIEFILGSEEPQKGLAENIGLGGILLLGPMEIPAGSVLKLKIGPYKKFPALNLEGKVVTKRFSHKDKLWTNGIQFTNLNNDNIKLLGDYVITVLKDSVNS